MGRFLAKRGPGLHHVAYQVTDVRPRSTRCATAACGSSTRQPRTGIRGSRVAFLHPASSGGVLTEIVQPSEEH